jgi:lysophospholipase L1-like esterase
MSTDSVASAGLEAEQDDPHCLSPGEIDRLLAAAPWRRFAVVGDSLAEGLGDRIDGYAPGSWADRVADALRRQTPELEYLNVGRRYLRTAEVRETQLQPALDFRPDLAAVICGGNDVLDPAADTAGLAAELDSVVAPLAATGATLITFKLLDITRALELPPEFGEHIRSRLELLADIWSELARRYDTVHVDMASHPASAEPGIYSADRMHANTRGHAIIASGTIEQLARRI